jgi:rsbT co-antagonist protein RsbR
MLRTLLQKVVVIAGLFLTVIVIASALSIISIFEVRAATNHLAEHMIIRSNLLHEISIDLTRMVLELESFLLAREEVDLNEAQEALDDAQNKLSALRMLIDEDDDLYDLQFRTDLIRLHDQLQTIIADAEAVVRTLPAVSTANTPDLLETTQALESTLVQIDDLIDEFIKKNTAYITGIITSETQRSLGLIAGLCGICISLVALTVWMLRRQIVTPIRRLSAVATGVIQGSFHHALQVTSNDEIGQLQRDVNAMVTTIQQEMHRRDEQMMIAQTARNEAETARTEVANQLATIDMQQAVIREMSVPILPLGANTLVMPLVGALDATRLQHLQEQALLAIEQRSTNYFILDITGVPVIDTHVAHGLIQVIQAARLLGTQVLIVGIQPEIAQTMVGLGIDFEGIITRSTLQEGISYTLQRPRSSVSPTRT